MPQQDTGFSPADRLQALALATVRVASAPTLDAVLQELTDQARGIIGTHLAATHLVRDLDWTKARVVVSLSDKYARYRGFDVSPVGIGIYSRVVQEGRPLRLSSAELHAHPAWQGYSAYADRHPPLRGLLAVPLSERGQVAVGVLMVSDFIAREPTAEDEAALVQLAQLASAVIEKTLAAQDLREREQHLSATYEHASVGIVEADAGGRILKANPAYCAITGYSAEELAERTFFDLTHPEDAESNRDLYERQVAGELGTYQFEKRYLRADGQIAWVQVSSSAVRDGTGAFRYAVRVVQDVTQRRRDEERQRLLMAELDHRVKNTLARVQAIAAQTLRGAASPEAFCRSFEARLKAMAGAHDLLNEAGWTGAGLRALLERELLVYQDGSSSRVILDGPEIALSGRATLGLGMAIHELATNAAKYGALSVPGGQVVVSWRVEDQDGGGRDLVLDWSERDGPPVEAPQRVGFGTNLVQAAVGHELGGEARLEYEREGMRCAMRMPLEHNQGKRMKVCDPMDGTVSGRPQPLKPSLSS